MKDTDQTMADAAEISLRALRAISQLTAAKKQRVSDYDERLRILRALLQDLLVKTTDTQQLEMFDAKSTLTPLLERYLTNPTAGLD